MTTRKLGYTIPEGTGFLNCTLSEFLGGHVGQSFSWLSIIIKNSELTVLRTKALRDALRKTRTRFLELCVSETDVNRVREFFPRFCEFRPDRLVMCFWSECEVDSLKKIIDDFLVQDIWVETRGVPYCKTYIEHVWENFNDVGTEFFNEGDDCNGCLFKEACRAIETGVFSNLKPLTESSVFEDFVRFTA
jgi:hypothetical protein